MFAHLLVHLYNFVHGSLHLPGAGWLIRKSLPYVQGLHTYRFKWPGVGTATLDFRDQAAFGMLNFQLGDFGMDKHLVESLETALQPGDVFWDVGANIGLISGYFSQPRFGLRAIHAFEPNPVPLGPLQSLFRDHPRVTVHPVALGDQDGELEMAACQDGSQISSVVRSIEGGRTIKIPVRAGDNYRRQLGLPAPQVMKIDVEGFEPNVFAGLSETIAENRPILFIEHAWLSDEQLRQLIPPSYHIRFILHNEPPVDDWAQRKKGLDAVLIPQEKQHVFPPLGATATAEAT